ncbi:uncharacterized protein LOC114749907 [Neltuma alba]|uniref:uncharacterized protein LOC114749907 n=1 Tax=Neltuma alba TaxID=207710 RepID=UPI0010A42F2E|nr:uncharacterized protein LOC114749907 [Prosopis alba]
MENMNHTAVNHLHTTANGNIHHRDHNHNHQPKPRSLKARLQNGECLYGMSLQSFSPTMAEIAGWIGYDFIMIDLEHGLGGISETLRCIHALNSSNTPVIVCIPKVNHVWVMKVLDLGPHGLIFPLDGIMIEKAVEKVVEIAAVEGVDGIMVGPVELMCKCGMHEGAKKREGEGDDEEDRDEGVGSEEEGGPGAFLGGNHCQKIFD